DGEKAAGVYDDARPAPPDTAEVRVADQNDARTRTEDACKRDSLGGRLEPAAKDLQRTPRRPAFARNGGQRCERSARDARLVQLERERGAFARGKPLLEVMKGI